ncbi:MAG: type IX secretion system membrane protein PorP/SprF [Bacteroidota bacterium]
MFDKAFFRGLLMGALGLLATSSLFAQQQSQYTQFMYNQLTVNPAYAGSRGMASLMALYRNQWLGFDGSPETKLLSFNAPIFDNKVGFGLTISNHTIGVMDSWYAAMAYSYNIQLGEESSLRIGIQGNIRALAIDFTDPSVVIRQTDDASVLENQSTNNYSGNFGAGAYLTVKNFYLGLSAPYIYPNEIGFNPDAQLTRIAQESPHFYAMAGTLIPMGANFRLKPAVLAKYVANAPFDLDVNLSVVYNLVLTAGVSYRLGGDGMGDSIDLLALYQFRNIALGIAYDYNLSDLRQHNSGSLEALVRFDFVKEQADMANPRFFF